MSVYATSRGPLRHIAEPIANRTRASRHRRFMELTGADRRPLRIVDVGCGALGLRGLAPNLDVTGIDLVGRPDYPGTYIQADATQPLPFDEGAFDLAYSSSVIEHIAPGERRAYADEIRRIARGWWVQTPAYSFPIEPHALLPVAHWLPARLRRAYWRLGAAGPWEDLALLRRRELAELFPGSEILPERIGPLAKSWIAFRAP